MKKEKGFTMIEILLGIVIVAILMVGIFSYLPKIMENKNIDNENKNLNSISILLNSFYQNQNNYKTVNNKNIIDAHLVPDNMNVDKNTYKIYNEWKGEIQFSSADKKINNNESIANGLYSITYQGLPKDACIKLISANKNNFYWIAVNNKTILSPDYEFKIENVNAICNMNKNNIAFYGN